MRICPGPDCTIIDNKPTGFLGIVVGGPVNTSQGVNWWQVNYDVDPDGWSFENNLTKYTPSLPGDLNGDRIINAIDFSIMNASWLTSNATADLNKDGIVNSLDFSILNGNWLKTY